MTIGLVIAGALLGFVYGLLKIDGIQRIVDKGNLWNAKRLRLRAVKLIDILRGPRFVDMMKTYPWWDISDQVYVGRRVITPLTIRAEQTSLNMARMAAKMPTQQVWTQPYGRSEILRSYDEVISCLEGYISDPERYETKLRTGAEILFLFAICLITIALGVTA